MGRQLSSLGIDPTSAINRARSKSRGRKRDRSVGGDTDGEDHMDVDNERSNKKMRLRSVSRPRSRSRPPTKELIPGEGYKDSAQKSKALMLGRKSTMKRNKDAKRGEADRVIPTLRPKHLYSGKRGKGKTDRR
jgi:nucleolar GTP-binding protein